MTFGIGHTHMLFLCCGWPCVPSNVLLVPNDFLHSCGYFLHCGWACAFSKWQLDQMISWILSKCASFFRYGWAFVDSGVQQNQLTSCTEHNWISFPNCRSPYASSEFLVNQMTSGILHICAFSFFGGRCRFLLALTCNNQCNDDDDDDDHLVLQGRDAVPPVTPSTVDTGDPAFKIIILLQIYL